MQYLAIFDEPSTLTMPESVYRTNAHPKRNTNQLDEERRSRSAPSKCAIRTTVAVSSDKDEYADMGMSSGIIAIRHLIFLNLVFPKIDLVVLLLSASGIGCSA
jgi:hypothetical protein